jgi:mono/diheme cytochrome c family protein
MKTVLATLGISVLLGVIAGLGVMYSGVFNVAATVEDAAPLQWVLITTREASIRRHARDIQAPSRPQQIENGFRFFRQQCVMCHTPPGGSVTMMSEGFNPKAPALAGLVEDMTDAQLFWVTKNGIRFTGMPAWGSSHNDSDIWDVVAFMRTTPNMKAADYDALDSRIPPTAQKTQTVVPTPASATR